MPEQSDKPEAQPKKRRVPLKTALILVSVLLLEGGAIGAAFFFAGRPSDVRAHGAAETLAAQGERPVELKVVDDRFQNTRTGRTYLYETEIYVVVKKKYSTKVETKLKEMDAQITTDIAQIFRRAEQAHLLEPTLATLTRQISAALDKRLGPDDDGKPLFSELLIRKCTQYRADL